MYKYVTIILIKIQAYFYKKIFFIYKMEQCNLEKINQKTVKRTKLTDEEIKSKKEQLEKFEMKKAEVRKI